MLAVRALTRPGLHPASFTLAAGECLSLGGPSGSGKTLLMRAIVDLDPNEGEINLNGRSRGSMAAPEWRRKVAYVPAESGWWADRVGEHFPDPAKSAPYLSRMGLAEDAFDWPVSRASTGEKQRLALLRAVVRGPEYLLLDEPTSALDEAARDRLEAVLRAEMENGVGLLLVTHDAAQARRFGGPRMRMEGGRITVENR